MRSAYRLLPRERSHVNNTPGMQQGNVPVARGVGIAAHYTGTAIGHDIFVASNAQATRAPLPLRSGVFIAKPAGSCTRNYILIYDRAILCAQLTHMASHAGLVIGAGLAWKQFDPLPR